MVKSKKRNHLLITCVNATFNHSNHDINEPEMIPTAALVVNHSLSHTKVRELC